MNIDERLEAIAQSVELLAEDMHEMQAVVAKQSETIDKILIAIDKDAENIRGLARIAEAHERRLSDLEDAQQS